MAWHRTCRDTSQSQRWPAGHVRNQIQLQGHGCLNPERCKSRFWQMSPISPQLAVLKVAGLGLGWACLILVQQRVVHYGPWIRWWWLYYLTRLCLKFRTVVELRGLRGQAVSCQTGGQPVSEPSSAENDGKAPGPLSTKEEEHPPPPRKRCCWETERQHHLADSLLFSPQ